MRISYLELRNYRRFRQLRLQFPDGIVGILGLNGAGKTTIIEAIAWTLFGNVDEVVRTSREGVRRVGASPSEPCAAILEFELGGVEYRIEREMSGRSLHMRASLRTKEKSLADGDRPVRSMVERLLGMDNKSFFTSVFARQKELNALQNVAAGERKKVILRMLRIDSIDVVLAAIRADKNSAHARIEGLENALLTEDGREKSNVLTERIPDLRRAFETNTEELARTEGEERKIAHSVEEVRGRRDSLKKDVDAYNSTQGDLRAKQSSIEELTRYRNSISARIRNDTPRLSKLHALSKDEETWKSISAKREDLEREKALSEKARLMAEGTSEDERDLDRRKHELSALAASVRELEGVKDGIEENEAARAQCEGEVQRLLAESGRAKARAQERAEASEREHKKLKEIEAAGPAGSCPTCEQTLEDAYDLLVRKLTGESETAGREAEEARKAAASLEAEMKGLVSKVEALKKKRVRLDQERTKLDTARATMSARETEVSSLQARLNKKRKDLAALGEIKFQPEEYRRILAEHERLRCAHDEYLGLKNLEAQIGYLKRELDEVGAKIVKASGDEAKYRDLLAVLEPKKNEYDSTVSELDAKNASLVATKDRARQIASAKERAHAELDRATKELADVERIKKTIELDRKMEEDLALLEDVVVNFRIDLIGRIAPALEALTSKGMESMTDGRYSRVTLDENYEMQIDDNGTMYPVSRFSGGESDLANLCLRLAISGIIADRTGANPVNLLILDEIFGSLDPSRKRSVMAALTRLSAQFRQVFLITHIEDVKDLMNHVINVTELEDGTSSAELLS